MSWIRAAATRAVLAAAKSRGLERAAVLAQARAADVPDDPAATVPIALHFAVIETCVRTLGDPGFVVDIAEHVPAETYDVVGFAMRSASDLGSAVEVARRYQPLYTTSSVFEVARDPNSMRIWMHPSGPLPLAARCATESAVGQWIQVARELAGVRIVPEHVGFRHRRPPSTSRHTAFFGADIEWEDPRFLEAPR